MVAGGAAPAVLAQEEAVQPRVVGGLTFMDELEVTVVNVVAHVTDKSGQPVTDLGRDDFEIYQDGDLKKLTNFRLYTEEVYRSYREPDPSIAPPPASAGAVAGTDTDLDIQPIYVILYVDNQNLNPMDRNRALSRIRAFVSENLQPPVQMMVVSYQKSLKILQPFTSDAGDVLQAVRSVRTATGGRTDLDSQREQLLDLMARYQEEAGSTGVRARSTREYQDIVSKAIAFADAEANDLVFSIQALRQVINVVSGLRGEKSILYLSNGMPMIPGMALFSAISSTYQDHSILNQVGRYDRTTLYNSLVETANAQNVTFYTLGAGGLEIEGMTSAANRSAQDPLAASRGAANYLDSMRFMASSTGGLAVLNTNDISIGLGRIKSNLFTYYSLGYALNASGGDKVHRISVKLRGHPDYTVQYRRRFVEKSRETRVQEKVFTGLLFDIDTNPMGVDVEMGAPSPAAEQRWTVPLHVSFELEAVALIPEGEDYVGRVTLFIAARDTEGRRSDLVRQEHQVRVPAADYEAAKRERFGIDVGLLMEEGSYRVSVGLMDQVTRQASYRTRATSVGNP